MASSFAQVPLGSLLLKDFAKCSLQSYVKPNSFAMTPRPGGNAKRTYYFATDSPEVSVDWVSAISELLPGHDSDERKYVFILRCLRILMDTGVERNGIFRYGSMGNHLFPGAP